MTGAPFPLRLPPRWREGPVVDGWRTAGPVSGPRPRPALLYRPVDSGESPAPTPRDLGDGLCARLPGGYVDLLVLDRSDTACRDGHPAHRVLSTHLSGVDSLTTEHWFVAGTGRVHLLVAVLPTARYAVLAPLAERALRSFREPPPGEAP